MTLAAGTTPARGQEPDATWHEQAAAIRFKVHLSTPPSHPNAGYIAELPDGGILPDRGPEFTVLDESGKPLPYGCLWRAPEHGAAIVFAPPAAGRHVFIYASAGPRLQVWSPRTGLTPSVVVFVRPGAHGLDAATALAKDFPPGNGVYFARSECLGMGGVPPGLTGEAVNYVLGYAEAKRPGRTFLAPMSEGDCAVRVDGEPLRLSREFELAAGAGEWRELERGLHRFELFHSAWLNARKRQWMRGHAWMWWRPPDTPASQLSPNKSGAPTWAAYPIYRDYGPDSPVQSGATRIVEILARDGTPVPVFTIEPRSYFNFEGFAPVILYSLKARTADHPRDTAYTWQIGSRKTGPGRTSLAWVFEADRDHRVTLAAGAAGREASATCRFHAFCSGRNRSSLESPAHRAAFRQAYINMLEAAPQGASPAEGWSRSVLDLCVRLAQPGEGNKLLLGLMSHGWAQTREALELSERRRLEDVFFAVLCATAPEQAVKWTELLSKGEMDARRLCELKLLRVEALMYYLGELDEARRLAQTLGNAPEPLGRVAQTRIADIALLAGNGDEARGMYADLQNRVRHGEAAARPQQPSGPVFSGLARSKAELEARRARENASRARSSAGPAGVDDWKIGAVRQTAASETVRSYTRQGHYYEAMGELLEWELEFPLSKLTGDFLLVEAELRAAMDDHARCRRLLETYIAAVEVTSYLPEAMRKLLHCLEATKAPREEVEALCLQIRKRFPYHPVAEEAGTLLKSFGHDVRPPGETEGP